MPGSRKDTTVKERLEIIQKLQNGVSVSDLANEYGLSKRCINKYRTNALQIQQLAETGNLKEMKRIRTSPVEEINIRLNTWILERRALGDTLTDNILQQKALELHREFGISTKFTASHGWLWRFKKRYNIHLVHTHDEQVDADKIAAEQFIEELARKIEQENINANNIYNMSESGLLWKNLPRKTLDRTKRMEGNKEKKDRVSIGFCANSTGTHKLPLLFIHKYACPRALKHIENNLPVVYKNQKNARMDEEIFDNWYINHFQPTVRQRQLRDNNTGKVLLLVNNFKNHNVRDEENEHFEIMFLPNTTSVLQPMEQEVIAKCKRSFRYNLLRKVVQCPRGIHEFYFNYDIKDCIDLIHDAWESVSQTNIYNAWRQLLERRNIEIKEKVEIKEEQIENYSFDEVNDWISHCEEAELIRENNEEITSRRHCEIAEDELEDLFDKLSLWAEIQPEFIQSHAKILIDYYHQK
ncbi:jerky protein homolog-like [Pseudomyrmex gracilis]|uniref:jerky protein homolog-like n=1 Tax=Pseudomyrmex gracilis TaxID=219809 RepID=UPI000995A761|nr:jerky protein homolog-like [Pseudomyrmex gracilis]